MDCAHDHRPHVNRVVGVPEPAAVVGDAGDHDVGGMDTAGGSERLDERRLDALDVVEKVQYSDVHCHNDINALEVVAQEALVAPAIKLTIRPSVAVCVGRAWCDGGGCGTIRVGGT